MSLHWLHARMLIHSDEAESDESGTERPLRARLVHGIFTGKSKEIKTEERIGGRAFGTEEIANHFLRNTVAGYRFHRKNQIQSDRLFSLPLRKPEATRPSHASKRGLSVINSYVINSCVPNSLNFLFLCFEIP